MYCVFPRRYISPYPRRNRRVFLCFLDILFFTRHPVFLFSYRRWRSNTSNRLVHARVSPDSMAAAKRAKPPPHAEQALAWLAPSPGWYPPGLTFVAHPICRVQSPRRPADARASRASRWEARLATRPPPQPPKGSAPRKVLARQSRVAKTRDSQ